MTTEITMTEKQSQQKKILEHLSKGYTLTPFQAIDVVGTMKLATRISELIRQGYPIVKEWYRTPSGKKVMSYRLMMEAV